MEFSMNGFRRQLSGECGNLRDITRAIVNDGYFDRDDLVECVNNIISHSNVLNCVYQKDDPDFIEMADLEVKHIDLDEVEEE